MRQPAILPAEEFAFTLNSLEDDLELHFDDEDDYWPVPQICAVCLIPTYDRPDINVMNCCKARVCTSCMTDLLVRNPVPMPCPNPACSFKSDNLTTDSNRPKAECIVCLDQVDQMLHTRRCCSQVVCQNCTREIVRTAIESEGKAHIPCPNPDCERGAIERDEIIKHVSGDLREKYERFRLQESGERGKKTCPNCCLVTEHRLPSRFKRFRAEDVRIQCEACQFAWCFRCHAPWHQDTTCKQFRRGEKQFKVWTKSKTRTGTANCQKCPLCRVYIQRSTGCDHMTCNRCKTHFCYKCGGLYNGVIGLGDHHTATSIFGCKYNYKVDRPAQRKAVRGGYLGAKLAMLTGYPVLFVAGAAVVVVVGVVALPIYAACKYYKFKKRTNSLYRRRRRHF